MKRKITDNKQIKPSIIKTIVVECKFKNSVDQDEFKINSDIFDDVYLEAATRFVENFINQRKTKISPILTVYEKNNKNDLNNYFCYNSYYIIINAGFYKKAEIMRKNFMTFSGIDLKKEKIKGENGNVDK